MKRDINYHITTDKTDGHFRFIFPEQIFEENFETAPKLFLNSDFAYYENLKETEKKIKELFEVNDERTYYQYIPQTNKIEEEEKVYIFKEGLILIKFRPYDLLEEDDEADRNMEIEKTKRTKISLYALKDSNEIKENFLKIVSNVIIKPKKDRELSILCYNQYEGFYLKPVKTLDTQVNLKDNYNDDVEELINYVVERLNTKDDKGIVFFHGIPGTGKTNLIRYLTKQIKDKPIIYIPPDFAINLSNPEFVTFFINHPNSILIIEDAENILKTRKSGGNQSVANLLSISDGLLGDGLRLQIVCTFNSDINKIDDALLREGRLIADYKFEELTVEKSQTLLNKLFSEKDIKDVPTITTPMTLAEIYNYKEKRFITKNTQAIGFGVKNKY